VHIFERAVSAKSVIGNPSENRLEGRHPRAASGFHPSAGNVRRFALDFDQIRKLRDLGDATKVLRTVLRSVNDNAMIVSLIRLASAPWERG